MPAGVEQRQEMGPSRFVTDRERFELISTRRQRRYDMFIPEVGSPYAERITSLVFTKAERLAAERGFSKTTRRYIRAALDFEAEEESSGAKDIVPELETGDLSERLYNYVDRLYDMGYSQREIQGMMEMQGKQFEGVAPTRMGTMPDVVREIVDGLHLGVEEYIEAKEEGFRDEAQRQSTKSAPR